MDEGGVAGKEQGEHPARRDDIAEADEGEQRVVVSERRAAQKIIDDPPERQRRDADQRRLPGRKWHDAGIHEENVDCPEYTQQSSAKPLIQVQDHCHLCQMSSSGSAVGASMYLLI